MMNETLKNNDKKSFFARNRLLIYLVFIVSFISFLSLFANKWISEQNIKKLIIKGNHVVPQSEIFSLIDTSYLSQKFENIDLLVLKNKINSHPYVLNSYAMRMNSSIITIEINERKPIAIINNSNGYLSFIDKFGATLPYRLSNKYSELTIISGVFNKGFINPVVLNESLIILNLLKQEFKKLYSFISEIKYDIKKHSYTFISTDRNIIIKLGKANNLHNKFSELRTFKSKLLPKLNTNKISYVDLRWNNRIVLKYNEDNKLN